MQKRPTHVEKGRAKEIYVYGKETCKRVLSGVNRGSVSLLAYLAYNYIESHSRNKTSFWGVY